VLYLRDTNGRANAAKPTALSGIVVRTPEMPTLRLTPTQAAEQGSHNRHTYPLLEEHLIRRPHIRQSPRSNHVTIVHPRHSVSPLDLPRCSARDSSLHDTINGGHILAAQSIADMARHVAVQWFLALGYARAVDVYVQLFEDPGIDGGELFLGVVHGVV